MRWNIHFTTSNYHDATQGVFYITQSEVAATDDQLTSILSIYARERKRGRGEVPAKPAGVCIQLDAKNIDRDPMRIYLTPEQAGQLGLKLIEHALYNK